MQTGGMPEIKVQVGRILMLSDKLTSCGVADQTDINNAWPSEERLKQGPVVVVECFQEIPCNPCETSCPCNAIKVGENINDLPMVDHSKCNGCTICVSRCPGLAIFAIDATYSETESLVTMPYEFLPLPDKGETVEMINRDGKTCGQAKVVRVINTKAQGKTPLVTLAVPKGMERSVRFFIKAEK
jgi:Fe-S-cluster-containing hydrogenase component 2